MDVSLYDLNISWVACFQGSRILKPVKTTLWMHPPNGALKLSFDGIFIKCEQKGGYCRGN